MSVATLDPQLRKSIAFGVVLLSITGLFLMSRGRGRDGFVDDRRAPVAHVDERARTEPAVPADPSPSTQSTFAGRGIAGRFAISHGRLLADGTRPLHVELRVHGEQAEGRVRAPVALVIVVDTSGSMAGRKIEDARRSAIAALDEMDPADSVSVVRFSDDAEVLVPLGRVEDVRARARAAISGMVASGNTNIARAVQVAASELARASEGRVARMAVVTDGRDTSGAPRGRAAEIARREADRGVTVSALGIGLDYDDAYLADLAAAGHGNYEFLRDASSLARFLARELSETARTRARRLILELELPAGARVKDAWGGTLDGRRVILGAVAVGDERRVVVPIDVPVAGAGSLASVGGKLTWTDADGRTAELPLSPLTALATESTEAVEDARDRSVHASVTSIEASRKEAEAASAFARGDRARALSLNRESQAALAQAAASAAPADARSLAAQQKAYKSDAHQYESAPPAAAPAREIGARENRNFARQAY